MIFNHPEFSMGYDDIGEGTTLLLIHGFPLTRKMWAPQTSVLSKFCRVIAPDLRGFGESPAPPGVHTMEKFALDCVALLDHLNISESIVLCGLSMGGYIAMAMCRHHISRLKGLVLVSTRAGEDTPEAKTNRLNTAKQVLQDGLDPLLATMRKNLLAPFSYRNKQLVQFIYEIMQESTILGVQGASLGMMERPDSHSTLRSIKIPTLIIHGNEDQLIPLDEVETMRKDIQNVSLKIIPDAGHLPNLEQPDIFNQTVKSFLQDFQSDHRIR